jgi:hypothetical protein
MRAREKYRKKAQAIVAQVENIRGPGERAGMLTIARAYHLRLADLVGARHDHGTSNRLTGDQHPENDS